MKRAFPRSLALALAFAIGLLASAALAESPKRRFPGPWDLEALAKPPQATWGKATGLVRDVYYEGEPLGGKPTRVYACYARPESGDGPFPAMVLVHGGGGHAFPEWATLWARRGYVALAMDLAGHGPDRARLPDGGPEQDDANKFRNFSDSDVGRMWSYHAVADVIRGHSLLASRPEVDPARVGITGISWGGYLTCIVAGLDDRLKVAVPVYGCGFLNDNSAWVGRLGALSPSSRERWVALFDPSRYLPGVRCPILFVNGTNDFAYPLDSYQKSYRLVPGPVDLCITVRMPHGHQPGWAPKEIGLFVDNVLKGGDPLARLGPLEIAEGKASATVTTRVPVVKAQLHVTTDTGPWSQRDWRSVDATVSQGKVSADLPEGRPAVVFLTVSDERGAVTSSPHAEVR